MCPRCNGHLERDDVLRLRHGRGVRRGLTLPELLISVAIMAIVAGVMSALASAVRHNYEHCASQGLAIQHSRVAMERIGRTVRGAYASESHPGCAVAYSGSDPVALLVWRPTGLPANPAGPPLVREVVIFAVNPDNAHFNQLLEVTRPSDSSTLPLNGTATYATVDALIRSAGSRVVLLTDLLRLPDSGGAGATQRGIARFAVEMRPTLAELTTFRQGTGAWNQLPWPQGLVGPTSAVRQVSVRIELQLAPGAPPTGIDVTGEQTLPFFGSAAFSYQVKK